MDTYADDLSELIETLDLKGAVLIGFSAGAVKWPAISAATGRNGWPSRAGSPAVPPLMLKTAANPGGLPIEAFDKIRLAPSPDRSQFYQDLASGPFFGANRPGAKVSQGMIDSFWLQGMQAGHKNTFDCIKAFSETDFTEDLKEVRRADVDPSRRRRPDRADPPPPRSAPRSSSGTRPSDLRGRTPRPRYTHKEATQRRPAGHP